MILKEKKFESMLGKCRENDKKIEELNEILNALGREKR